jgi:hypothetical protein
MIWLGLILLLQYFIFNRVMSMFRSIRFLYAIFVMVMIYLRINLKLKLLFFPTGWSYSFTYSVKQAYTYLDEAHSIGAFR